MNKVRIIGDVHGEYRKYKELADQSKYSIQVGDLGFNYNVLHELDHTRHIVIPGNHDNYDKVHLYDHILCSFGEYELNGLEFYFVRGGFSIDWAARLQQQNYSGQKTWFSEEELCYTKLINAVELFEKVKPDFVITHEAPRSIIHNITDGRILKNYGYDPEKFTTRTSEALQCMFEAHQPKEWIFGHYHRSWSDTINGTKFRCLAELEVYDYEFHP